MREPPKIPQFTADESVEESLRRTIAAMNALAEWMAECAQKMAPPRCLSDCPAWQGGECDCGADNVGGGDA